ncbi:unnamed protein product [Prorocentrum cordatum]|uniref:Ion transport domain-containing protein n=1 Tax=Prorocentrum cordatum TaxID=2364126 RepID=A0ABN9XFZ3_9DINO|nr:unnamed protein product [Polarella glacialis]
MWASPEEAAGSGEEWPARGDLAAPLLPSTGRAAAAAEGRRREALGPEVVLGSGSGPPDLLLEHGRGARPRAQSDGSSGGKPRPRAHSDLEVRRIGSSGGRPRAFSFRRATSGATHSCNMGGLGGPKSGWDEFGDAGVDLFRRANSYGGAAGGLGFASEVGIVGGTFDLSHISPELANVALSIPGDAAVEGEFSRLTSWSSSRERLDSGWRTTMEEPPPPFSFTPKHKVEVRAVLDNQLAEKCADVLVIDPSRSNSWIHTWDILSVATLLFVAIFQPLQTAFGEPDLVCFRVVNHIIFVIFFADMCLQFFIAYPNSEHPDIFVRDPRGIVKRYLRSWFVVDFLSASPLELYNWVTGGGRHREIQLLRLLRLVRLLRLTHLRRLRRRMTSSGVPRTRPCR